MAQSNNCVKSAVQSTSVSGKGNLSLQFVNCPGDNNGRAGGRNSAMKSGCFGRANRLRVSPAQILFDLLIFAIVATPVAVFFFVISPHRIGFFCDDNSIRYPYHPDTISTTMLVLLGLLIPLLVMVLVEFFNKRRKKLVLGSPTRFIDACKGYAVFLFGGLVTEMFVEMAKTSIGRLRPHFIDVCQPDWSKINCSTGYILNYECTNSKKFSPTTLKDSHLSFPSGHAAFSAYCALYAVFYIQLRFNINRTQLLKPSLQLTLAVLAFYCNVTRVMDFKHHPTDVIGGAFIGCLIAFIIFFKLAVPVMKTSVPSVLPTHQNNHRKPHFHHMDSVMTTVSSCPSDVGSYQAVSEDSSDHAITGTNAPVPLITKDMA
ncbi:phospholipid phosphatase 1-like [Liolophura sinensis]|uniref:phospholipid phosphatase 1-like n=1 Tax=Liolophura sinensis TaxID=3198878 RepID=UPI0031582AFE